MEIFKLVGSIFVDSSAAQDSISKTDKKAEGLGHKFGSVAGKAGKFGLAVGKTAAMGAVALGTAAIAGGAAIVGLAEKSADACDVIDKMSNKIGISKTGYQEWAYAMDQSGMDISKMQVGLKTLTSKMDAASQGTKSAKDLFSKLGLSVTDSTGKLKSQEDMMNESIIALASMENGTEKARLATQLFGKAGIEMMPMLNGGAQSIEDLKNRAHDLGLVMSDEAVTAGVTLGDTMDDVKASFGMVATKVGTEVFPIVQKFLDFILENMPVIQSVVSQVFGYIGNFVTWFFGIMQEVIPVVQDLIQGLVTNITGKFGEMNITTTTVLDTMKNYFKLCIDFWIKVWNDLGKPLFDVIVSVVSVVVNFFVQNWGSISTLFKTVFDMCKVVWDTILKPVFDMIVFAVTQVMKAFNDNMPAISKLFKDVVGTIKEQWDENLKPVFEIIGDFLTTKLKPAFEFVFGKIIGPVVKAAFDNIARLWNDFLKPIFNGICEFLNGVFTGNWKKAFDGLAKMIKGVFGGIKDVMLAPFRALAKIWNDTIGKIKFTLPDWIPGIGGKSFGMPTIPSFAKGTDWFGGGAALVGENGPELVDLPRGSRVTATDKLKTALSDVDNQDTRKLLAEQKKTNELLAALLQKDKILWNDRELGRFINNYV